MGGAGGQVFYRWDLPGGEILNASYIGKFGLVDPDQLNFTRLHKE
jgi:hypothetical protein